MISLDNSGEWSGGGAAFLKNWAWAVESEAIDKTITRNTSLIARNIPTARLPKRPYIVAPQNAWPWQPRHSTAQEAARLYAMRVLSYAYGRCSFGQLRISEAIPAFFQDVRTSPVIHNVLDPGFEDAARTSLHLDPLPYSRGAIVSIGSFNTYRNLENLVLAYHRYRANGGNRGMVIAGSPSNSRVVCGITELANRLPTDGITLYCQSIPRARAIASMAAASVVILPSLVEASPLTLLEAAWANPNCIYSGIPGHIGLVRGYLEAGAQHFDPMSLESMTAAILSADTTTNLTDLHGMLRTSGLIRHYRTSWALSIKSWLQDLAILDRHATLEQ